MSTPVSTSPAPSPDPSVPPAPLDLSSPLRLHVVGVGGPGMSAIAIVLGEMGHAVSGSDLVRSRRSTASVPPASPSVWT